MKKRQAKKQKKLAHQLRHGDLGKFKRELRKMPPIKHRKRWRQKIKWWRITWRKDRKRWRKRREEHESF